MRAIDQKVGAISDEETLMLFDELRQVTGIDPAHFADLTVYQFLHLCIHPNGGTFPPIKITRECIDQVDDHDAFLLRKKAGKVGDALHRLLRGLVPTLDKHSGRAIYVLLNRSMAPTKKKDPNRYFRQ